MPHADRTDPLSFLPLPHKSLDLLLSLVHGEAHGYGIKRFVEERSGASMRAATLYEGLARLHRDGLILESESQQDEAGTSRWRFYRLSDLGRAVLSAELTRLSSILDEARNAGFLGARGLAEEL